MTPPAPGARAFAAAKVNLFLHVGPLGADGYHPIASLFVFADIGDTLRLAAGASGRLTIEGPFGDGLSAGPDNLVARARAALSPGLATDLIL
jgi:4-diphosphocytidyl-2-C-methyl-D-erythritol kinase